MLRLIEVAVSASTVTLQVAEALPLLTFIVAVPGAMAVTTPVAETVATPSLSDDQVRVLSVVFVGDTVAVKVVVAPTFMVISSTLRVTEVEVMGFTVTLQVAVLLPFLTVIVAVPGAMAVTTPVVDTVATLSLSDDHVRVLSVVFAGDTVPVSVEVAPTSSVNASSLRVRLVDTTGVTVTSQVPV